MFKGLDRWLPAYLMRRRAARPDGPLHVMLAVCDHFEPRHDARDEGEAEQRVGHWLRAHPELQARCRENGWPVPRHSFFYPVEQYREALLTPLAELCRVSGGEIELHLHHDKDTRASLRDQLLRGVDDLAKHGALSRDAGGRPHYGFIHGNWALDHSDPRGVNCGVADELGLLRETGCYADFTMPSAPHPTQTRTINSIYYARCTPEPKSHDRGRAASVGATGLRELEDHLLMVQGPLGLNWRLRKRGIFPRIENGDLTQVNPPRLERFELWRRLGVHVRGLGSWVFVKLHTHGGVPRNYDMLLGEPMLEFCRALGGLLQRDPLLNIRWVSARQMVNLVHAAEDGASGDPVPWLDHRYPAPPLHGGDAGGGS